MEPRQVDLIAAQLDRAHDLRELPAGTAKEIEYVLDLAPRYLGLVGPETVEPAAHLFAVKVDGLTARFTRLDAFPAPPAQRVVPTAPPAPSTDTAAADVDEFACPQCRSDDVRGHRSRADGHPGLQGVTVPPGVRRDPVGFRVVLVDHRDVPACLVLIRHGESVKVVSERMGNTGDETLRTYTHLWEDADDQTREAVDVALGEALAGFVSPPCQKAVGGE